MDRHMNIVVTLNRNYLRPLCVMLRSLLDANARRDVHVYILHTELTEADVAFVRDTLGAGRYGLHPIAVARDFLQDAPVTFHFSREMYFRIFAAALLPQEVERALYLDPDMVVLGDLSPLYDREMDDRFFAAARSINAIAEVGYKMRLHMPAQSHYFNSGVLLMNLSLLRREQNLQAALTYIESHKAQLVLPDQDTLNALYHTRTEVLDPHIYNLDMRYFGLMHASSLGKTDLDTVRAQTLIAHYCGKHKPWNKDYSAPQGVFYWEAQARTFR